jgi:hypothetical protein
MTTVAWVGKTTPGGAESAARPLNSSGPESLVTAFL